MIDLGSTWNVHVSSWGTSLRLGSIILIAVALGLDGSENTVAKRTAANARFATQLFKPGQEPEDG